MRKSAPNTITYDGFSVFQPGALNWTCPVGDLRLGPEQINPIALDMPISLCIEPPEIGRH
jgi:hypothetical protein